MKLDRALIARIDTDRRARPSWRAWSTFTGMIHATLIAEGVETAEERDALLELGVGIGQGYLLGRPAPADQGLTGPRSVA